VGRFYFENHVLKGLAIKFQIVLMNAKPWRLYKESGERIGKIDKVLIATRRRGGVGW
jgi:hypothetical protein